MNEYLIGINIGSSKICAAIGKIDKQDRLQIIGITSAKCSGLKKGIVIDIDSTSEAVKKCISQLETMVDIEIDNAFISLPGSICELVPSRGVIAIASDNGEITHSDISRVHEAAKIIGVPSEKEIIGIISNQYIIDGYENIKDPVGMSGARLEVEGEVVLVPSTIVSNLMKSLKKAGINVKGFVIEPIAISKLALKKLESNIGTAIVDVGAETINISVFKDEKLCYMDMIPLGGNIITNDLSVCLKIPFTEAENLKVKYGIVGNEFGNYNEKIKVNTGFNDQIYVETDMLQQILEARIEELLLMIQKKLMDSGYYEQISGVVLVGGGIALFKGITEFGKMILNKSIRVGTPEYVGAASPVYAATVGIIKDAVETLSLNSIHKDYEEVDENTFSKKQMNKSNNNFISKVKNFFTDIF